MTGDEMLVLIDAIDKAVTPLGYEAITLSEEEDYVACYIQKRSEEE